MVVHYTYLTEIDKRYMKNVPHYCYHYFTPAQDHNIYIFNFLHVNLSDLSVR